MIAMNRKSLYILRGIGIGFILSAALFFGYENFLMEKEKEVLTDEEIKVKAHDLGMVSITRIDEVYLTDEEVIEKAKELGMIFPEKTE